MMDQKHMENLQQMLMNMDYDRVIQVVTLRQDEETVHLQMELEEKVQLALIQELLWGY